MTFLGLRCKDRKGRTGAAGRQSGAGWARKVGARAWSNFLLISHGSWELPFLHPSCSVPNHRAPRSLLDLSVSKSAERADPKASTAVAFLRRRLHLPPPGATSGCHAFVSLGLATPAALRLRFGNFGLFGHPVQAASDLPSVYHSFYYRVLLLAESINS
ncbi:hypothetical protein AXG93_1543s1010 [Marchantia polymorpha subsp. ruderalis]|uniref:Uncharacterized protein n=1 Tax=Marchantia polymorpha subsp. ruderalis TaxID=1480154 RepID=A0A176VXJ7_MARPO|nr:hypothetical protein AXG93_1543s1010 [Marchantia polymorpha subsp. ruderalis]